MKCLVENAADLRNSYSITQTGETPHMNNRGQNHIEFIASEGKGHSMTFQIADVNHILA